MATVTWIRLALAVGGVATVVTAIAFGRQTGWAVDIWPWAMSRLSFIFVASILAAVAIAMLWTAMTGQLFALLPGMLNLAVMSGGIAAFLFREAQNGRDDLWPHAVAAGAVALTNAVAFVAFVGRRIPLSHPLPPVLRGIYAFYTVLLLVTGLAMITGAADVLPWTLDPDSAVVFGWVFFSDAFYFAYAVARPNWESGRVQLWSFLVYDLVLIGPMVDHFAAVPDDLRVNLVLYVAVLVGSAAVSVYYLLRYRPFGTSLAAG